MNEGTYIGMVRLFAGNYAPEGWMFCDGQELRMVDHQVLYAVIGNLYGSHSSQTFCLPKIDPLKTASVTPIRYIICVNGGLFPMRA
jgi:microcystin-dependent protein